MPGPVLIATSAPIRRASSRLASERLTAIARQPRWAASWTALAPIPPIPEHHHRLAGPGTGSLHESVVGRGHRIGEYRDGGRIVLFAHRDDRPGGNDHPLGKGAVELHPHAAHPQAHVHPPGQAYPARPAVVDVVEGYRLAGADRIDSGPQG